MVTVVVLQNGLVVFENVEVFMTAEEYAEVKEVQEIIDRYDFGL